MTTFSKNCAPGMGQNLNQVQQGLYRSLLQWIQIQALKMSVAQERKHLLTLSDASLDDLGLTRFDANIEAFRRDLPAARLNAIKSVRC